MQEGFPFKKRITDRPNSINYGDDYRYRYDLCMVARTVVVTDTAEDVGTITPQSIASTSRVATINLTAGFFYHSMLYRPIGKQVWVFGTQHVIVIDANPQSATFNTIINTITTTAFNTANQAVFYSPVKDLFFFGGATAILNPVTNQIFTGAAGFAQVMGVSKVFNFASSAGHAYFPSFDGNVVGGVNGFQIGFVMDGDNNIKYNCESNNFRFATYIIGNKLYSGTGSSYRRHNLESSPVFVEAAIGMAEAITAGDSAYDPEAQKMVIVGTLGTQVNVVSIRPTFTSIGQLRTSLTSLLATNQNSYYSAMYSPYSKKVYLRAGFISTRNGTGGDRYIILDLNRTALADMICGYRQIDQGYHTFAAGYINVVSCFNGLKVNEYV